MQIASILFCALRPTNSLHYFETKNFCDLRLINYNRLWQPSKLAEQSISSKRIQKIGEKARYLILIRRQKTPIYMNGIEKYYHQ